MTNRTHDLAAMTTLVVTASFASLPQMTLATVVVAVGANLLGAVVPDLDQPTAEFWNRIPAGTILGRLVHPLMGTHRLISHSIVGVILAGIGLKHLLTAIGGVLLVDMNVVWWATMMGYLSHMVMDTFTREGVPWLFPIPIRFGFPPFKFLRITTGGMIEKGVIFPGLLILNGYLIYQNYTKFLEILRQLTR